MDPNNEPEPSDPSDPSVYDAESETPTPAPHSFDRKYFKHWVKSGQRFEGEVNDPYGLHDGLSIKGPPNMDQIWPYSEELSGGHEIDYLGEDWKKIAPPSKRDGLYPEQMAYLQSELMRKIKFSQVLGTGAFSIVWEVVAQHRETIEGRIEPFADDADGIERQTAKFACKVIRHQKGTRASIEASLNDMKILRYLRHENICNIKDIIGIPDSQTGFPYAVVCVFFELCNGTLGDFILLGSYEIGSSNDDNWCLPEELNKHWFRHALKGLAYIHEKNVVHKDIKDDNILYRCEPPLPDDYRQKFLESIYKLSDFGISESEYDIRNTSEKETAISFENLEQEDVNQLFSNLLSNAIPTLSSDDSREQRPKFIKYCNDRKWMSGYPGEWKTLSLELLNLVQSFESRKKTAMELLNDPWLLN